MNRLWYHIVRWVLVIIPVFLAAASAMAQLSVYRGQTTNLSITPKPGETYYWELYSDSTVDFAIDAGNVSASVAEFVNGIDTGPSVNVIWYQPGIYFVKVTTLNESQCTDNIQVGKVVILETANETLEPPIAIDDYYEVNCDEQFFVITANDEYDENQNIFVSILEWPSQGILHELDDQGNVSYTVDFFTHGTDSFTYTLCFDQDQTMCDTATVHITIPDDLDCDPASPLELPEDTTCHFFIPEGFSPNGDGVHDYFVIDCIERYPKAKLMVFDKQGYLLYEKENYGNTNVWGYSEADLWWGGQTTKHSHNSSGMVIPGVYLYVLDKGNGDLERGFVMVAYGNAASGN